MSTSTPEVMAAPAAAITPLKNGERRSSGRPAAGGLLGAGYSSSRRASSSALIAEISASAICTSASRCW